MGLFEHTLFINLENRTDRLEHVTNELQKIGVVGERFNACRTKDGAIGCSMSHIKCLELARKRNYEAVFICEDDITFLNPAILLDSLQKFENNCELEWDVLIIGGNNAPPYEMCNDHCIRVHSCQTTTGYVVKKHYYNTLIKNFRESVSNLLRDPENKRVYALDMYWKRLQTTGKWYMLYPLTVVQCDGYSDIEERDVDYRGLMLDMEKKWLLQNLPGRQIELS
jgi:GR25 family glycosyltransferase involved in LPS biosynthesis